MHGPRNGEFARVLGSRHVTLIGSLRSWTTKTFEVSNYQLMRT